MHNQEDSAKTTLDEFEKVMQNFEKDILKEFERMLLKDMKAFIGKLFYETTKNGAPEYIHPRIVQEIYISQEDDVYVRDQHGNLYKFDTVTFLKKIA